MFENYTLITCSSDQIPNFETTNLFHENEFANFPRAANKQLDRHFFPILTLKQKSVLSRPKRKKYQDS